MDKVLETIKEEVNKELKDMDIWVDDIVFENENNINFLRITLDRVNGLDLDTIVEATNKVNPLLDKLDPIEDSYILDISSKERG